MGFKDAFAGLAGRFRASDDDDDLDQQRYSDDADFFFETLTRKKSAAGIRITPDVALRSSAFFACARILAETIGSVPFAMFEKVGQGLIPAPSHPLDELIRFQPNTTQTAVEFWEMMILHAAIRGTAYAEIVPGPRGAVDQLLPLRPDRVTQETAADGTLRFRITDPHTNQSRVLLSDEVLRIPGISADGTRGLSIVEYATDVLGLSLAADQYASRVFSNNLNMGGFISLQKKISPAAQRRLIHLLMDKFANPKNFHRPAILQDGAKYEKASMTANEAQLLEARKYQIAEIARFLRIPLHLLNIDDQTNRSTVEEQTINFVRYTIRPWVRRIEQAVRRDLVIATSRYEAKMNIDALERGNLAARQAYWSAALGNSGRGAWMAVNEVRVAEGLNPINEPWANMVGGVSPSQSVTPLPSPDEQKALGAPTETPRLEDNTPETVAKRVANKENAAMRKASERFASDPDGMREYIRAFYGGHVSFVMDNLGFDRDSAKVYCAHQRDEALGANDLVGLIDRREEHLAATIATALRNHGVQNGSEAVQA